MSIEEAQLISMGFSLEQSQVALRRCGNNVEHACNLLLERGGRVTPPPSSSLESGSREETKMVLVVRTDLGMGTGKCCAQCSHAAVDVVLRIQDSGTARQREWLEQWLSEGCAKIVLRSEGGEAELRSLESVAKGQGLPCAIIKDAGRTQVAPGTVTVLGVGPGPRSVVDTVTGALKLLS